MARKNTRRGPRFTRFIGPVLEALQDLGRSRRPDEVVDWILNKMDVPEEDQTTLLSGGQSRFVNEVHRARFYLAKTG